MSTDITQQLQRDIKDIFTIIGCSDGTFSLQIKSDSKPYQVSLRHVAYVLLKQFKRELENPLQQDIKTLLGIGKTVEWCKSFIVLPKPNGIVRLCLDPVRLNQALIRPAHREPTCIDISKKMNNAKYLSPIDVSSGYHNLKLDEEPSFLITFDSKDYDDILQKIPQICR